MTDVRFLLWFGDVLSTELRALLQLVVCVRDFDVDMCPIPVTPLMHKHGAKIDNGLAT